MKKEYKKRFSQIGQDIWVIQTLKNKKTGIYVDIGAGHPTNINNTYMLEKEFNWSGISFDVGPPYAYNCEHLSLTEYEKLWNQERDSNNKLICCDALKVDYSEVFKEYNLPKNIDYLSMDLEPPLATFECLKLIPFDQYKFKVITFETDYYKQKNTQAPSRELLNSYGYKLVKSVKNQDDWYIHESYQL